MPTGAVSIAANEALPADLVERFAGALERLNPGSGKIGLAVSGGSDSMAMLLLAQAAIPGGFEVATVDHGLRPEAADECALVQQACEERGIACAVLSVEVARGNVQAGARRARYDALGNWAEARGLVAVATAHHVEDQAETLLMRLNRASGISGLAGIRDRLETPFAGAIAGSTCTVIRPLLAFRRDELRRAVEQAGAPFVTDPSNQDERFDRVRMRKALAESDWLDPAAIAASAGNLADALDALDRMARNFYDRHVIREGSGDEPQMRLSMPPGTPRYIVHETVDVLVRNVGGDPRGGDVARLIERLESGEGGNLAGVLVTVAGDEWLFRREPPRRT